MGMQLSAELTFGRIVERGWVVVEQEVEVDSTHSKKADFAV